MEFKRSQATQVHHVYVIEERPEVRIVIVSQTGKPYWVELQRFDAFGDSWVPIHGLKRHATTWAQAQGQAKKLVEGYTNAQR